YRRAREAAPAGGAASVTVCTNDVALGDLVEHGLPVALGEPVRDVEALVGQVVELEDERVGLSAVDTRVLAEHQIRGAFRDQRAFSASRIRDVTLPVRQVVLASVSRSAGAAVVVAPTAWVAAPRKVRSCLALSATSASRVRFRISIHEHTFACMPDGAGEPSLPMSVESRCSTGSGAVW